MSANNKGSKIGSVIGTGVLAITCLAVGWTACQMMPKGGGEGEAEKPDMRKMSAQVAVTNAVLMEYNLPQRYVAHVEAMAEVDLVPQVDGYIKEIKFSEGETVKEGQLLYVLDDEKYQAIVGQAKADLKAAEAESRRATRYYERMKAADDRGVTQLERDNAEAAADKAEAAVFQAKANLVVAEYNCKKAKVFAPISGKIGKTNVHIGDLVSPSVKLAHIVQIDPIRVTFPLTDRDYLEALAAKKAGKEKNMRMRLILPNGEEYDQEGFIDFDDNEMSKETATMIVRLKFPNPDRMLVPNAYVEVLSDYQIPPKYLCVPQQCVVDLSGGSLGVWVVADDMTVSPKSVKVREASNGWMPIIEGVMESDRVVLSGVGKLMAGQTVTLHEPTSNEDINPNHKSIGSEK